jgi:S1-C subfamily serine protease
MIFPLKHRNKLLLMGFMLAAAGLACSLVIPSSAPPTSPPQAQAITVQAPAQVEAPTPMPLPQDISSEEALLVNLYNRINPAVVNITVYLLQNGELIPASQGSGFVYDDSGHIVTNAHVVHGADEVDITFPDNTIRVGQIVGEDLHSDLAVVKIEDMPGSTNPLELGDLDSVRVGESVIAIGNPFGLEGTLTKGLVSAIGRTIPALTVFSIPQAIQTDAAINPGNSGGPLLNLEGQVIGVNAQIETDGTSRANSGVGFAIPVSMVKMVVPALIENGEYQWAWLGVRGGNLDPFLVEAMDLPVEKGAYIVFVEPDGPADKAGLQGANDTATVDQHTVDVGGDVIIQVDDQPVRSFDDLLIYIALDTHPGQQVSLTLIRNGEQRQVDVTLEQRPESLSTIPQQTPQPFPFPFVTPSP